MSAGTQEATCHDCARPYGDEFGFPDLVVSDETWKRISPSGDEGGLLCPSCLCKRAHAAGIRVETAVFTSGPFTALTKAEQEQDEAVKRAEKAEEMAFVPGRWRCAKCALVLTSTNLHVADGGMSANNEPHVCPNNCGPMWRVSERDERKEAQRSFIDLHEKSTRETARADAAVAEVKALREENDTLRGIVATSALDCVYCGLPASRMAECASGFPGCGRADDIAARATLAQPAADGGK